MHNTLHAILEMNGYEAYGPTKLDLLNSDIQVNLMAVTSRITEKSTVTKYLRKIKQTKSYAWAAFVWQDDDKWSYIFLFHFHLSERKWMYIGLEALSPAKITQKEYIERKVGHFNLPYRLEEKVK